MNGRFAALLGVVLGALTIRLTLSGEYLNYVRKGMFFWLLLSGAILIVLGAVGWMAARTASPGDHAGDCSHGHSHALSRAAWLLMVPVLMVGLTQPAPLGSFAASRQTAAVPRQSSDVAALLQKVANQSALAPQATAHEPLVDGYAPAEPTDAAAGEPSPPSVAGIAIPQPAPGEVAEMPLLDFLEITYYDDSGALAGVPVRLVGFVMPAADSGGRGFLLSRFMINCCAADATLLQTAIKEVKGGLPAQDTWVAVTGRWYPGEPNSQWSPDGFPVPELVADKVELIPQPENPYISLAVTSAGPGPAGHCAGTS